MDLFRKAGKKFEETKQAVTGNADSAYRCAACEQPVEKDYDYCPHCGADNVELAPADR